jgi:hypothetical protein
VAFIVSLRAGATCDAGEAVRIELRADGRDEGAGIAAGDEAQLQMRGGAAGNRVDGCSGLPVLKASTSSVLKPNTRSAGVSPVRPSRGRSPARRARRVRCRASARRTLSGIGAGRRPGTRIAPRASTSEAIACARIVPGLASSPPQLPE